MTPKEKAKELVDKYSIKASVYFIEDSIPRIVNADLRKESAKQYALIAVDEIIKEKKECSKYECYGNNLNFWQEVEQEIEKL